MALKFGIEERDLSRVIMGYLKEKRLFETLTSFQLETGVTDVAVGKDIAFLQRLTLEGRWDDLLLFIQPFQNVITNYGDMEFIILRQQYLEALCWQGGGGHRHALLPWKPNGGGDDSVLDGELNVDTLAAMLSALEHKCPPKEFNSLCMCLTVERLGDHPEFENWSVSEGRLDCYAQLKRIVEPLFAPEKVSDSNGKNTRNCATGGLQTMVAMGLAYQMLQGTSGSGTRNSRSMNKVSLIRGSLLVAEGADDLLVQQMQSSSSMLPSLELLNPTGNQLYPGPSSGAAAVTTRQSQPVPSSSSTITTAPTTTKRITIQEPGRSRDGSPRAIDRPPPSSLNINNSSPTRQPAVSWTVSAGGIDGSDESKNGNQNIIKERPARLVGRVVADPSPMKTSVASSPSRQTTAHVPTRSPKTVGSHHSPMATLKQPAGRNHSTQPSSQTSSPMKHGAGASGGEVQLQVSGTVLYKSDCPLRCVLAMGDDLGRGKSDHGNERRSLVVGSNDKSVKVLAYGEQDVLANNANDSVEVVKVFNDVHRGSVYAMDCVHNGTGDDESSLLATASNDKAVRLINIESGTVSSPMKGHTGTIRTLSFQPQQHTATAPLLLASAGAGDNRPRLWDVATGTMTGTANSVLTAHDYAVHGLCWLQHDLLISGCERGKLIAHDLRSPTPAWMLDLTQDHPSLAAATGSSGSGAGICCLASLPLSHTTSSSSVVVGYTGGYVCVVDAGRGRRVEAVHRPHKDDVRSIAVCTPWSAGSSSSGSNSLTSQHTFGLATTSFDGCAALWNVDQHTTNGATAATIDKTFMSRGILKGHADKVLGISIISNRNGDAHKKVVTTGADGQVILWDPRSVFR